MANIYETNSFKSQFESSIFKEQIQRRILNYKNRVELKAGGSTLRQYGNKLYVARFLGSNNTRIIIQDYRYDDYKDIPCYFVREIIPPSSYPSEWKRNIEPQLKDQSWVEKNPLTKDEIEDAKKDFFSKPILNKPIPEEGISKWMNDFSIDVDLHIYESEGWVDFSSKKMKSRNLRLYFEILSNLVLNKDYEVTQCIYKKIGDRTLLKAEREGVHIIYEKDESTSILLHYGGSNEDSYKMDSLDDEVKKFGEALLSSNDFNKFAHRAYGQNSLKIWDNWANIQKNSPNSNLSISSEQNKILKNIKFPRFINGQAGSGKSTLLYYIFAKICYLKLIHSEFPDDGIKGRVLFLTENEILLKKSLLEVQGILRLNQDYADYLTPQQIDAVKYFFSPFQNFLLYKILDEDELQIFSGKYISFSEFKRQYKQTKFVTSSTKRKCPPERAWFVISTYIKGYTTKYDEITPELFEDDTIILNKDKTQVTSDIFNLVYEKVWKVWYKSYTKPNIDNRNDVINYENFDRQDLVRYILNSYIDFAEKYTVIFSDEAQDFSRIELQLLFKMSSFTNYDLKYQEQVPILFAGDPLQTVNPTGFNIENIKRLFSSELTDKLDFKLPNKDLEIELNYNYRSNPGIVRLANLIQFFRYKYLEQASALSPQIARKSTEDKPYIINLESGISESSLKRRLNNADFSVILPCDENEENQYSNQYSVLKGLKNTISSISSKGSEYIKVVAFGFGEYFLKIEGVSNKTLENIILNNTDNEEVLFEIAFFFNKLYVAITRAQKKLFIIDSADGIKYFWNQLIFNDNIKQDVSYNNDWLEVMFPSDVNHNFILTLKEDKEIEHQLGDFEPEVARKHADEMWERSHTLRDSSLMEKTADLYSLLEDYNKSDLCHAFALEFDRNWLAAGEKFASLHEQEENIIRCYWNGGLWNELISLPIDLENNSMFKGRYLIANFIQNDVFSLESFYKNQFEIKTIIKKAYENSDINWFNTLKQKIVLKIEDLVNNNKDYNKVITIFSSLIFLDHKIKPHLGECYYKNDDFENAVDIWSKIDFDTLNKEYQKHFLYSKEKTTKDINEKIDVLYLLSTSYFEHQRIDEIIDLYESSDSNFNKIDIVYTIYLKRFNFKKLLELKRGYDFTEVIKYLSKGDEILKKINLFLEELYDFLLNNTDDIKRYLSSNFFENLLLFYSKTNFYTDKFEKQTADNFITLLKKYNSSDLDLCINTMNLIGISNLKPDNIKIKNDYSLKDFFYQELANAIKYLVIDGFISLDRISLKVFACAFEKTTQRDENMLEFYDQFMLKTDLVTEEQDFAQVRWLKRKYLFLSQKHKDKKEIEEQLNLDYRRLVKQLDLTLKEWNIDEIEKLPQYPSYFTNYSNYLKLIPQSAKSVAKKIRTKITKDIIETYFNNTLKVYEQELFDATLLRARKTVESICVYVIHIHNNNTSTKSLPLSKTIEKVRVIIPDLIEDIFFHKETDNILSKINTISEYAKIATHALGENEDAFKDYAKIVIRYLKEALQWLNGFEDKLKEVTTKKVDLETIIKRKGVIQYALQSLNINNFQCIQKASVEDIPISSKFIFITGENGDGKTTVLKAIAVTLAGNRAGNILLIPNKKDTSISLEVSMPNGSNSIILFSDKNEEKKFPVLAYGASRLQMQDEESSENFRERSNNIYNLFSEDAKLQNIEYWLKLKLLDNEHKFVDNVLETISNLLPNIDKITYEKSRKTEFKYHEKGTQISDVNYLSAGHKSLLLLVGDIIIKLSNTQDVSHPKDLAGIVLIDEIEAHLHPNWQKEIADLLARTFPKIQFIVTTHSVITFLGAPKNSTFIKVNRISKKGTTLSKINIDIQNLIPNQLLTSPLFDMDSFINKNNNGLENIRTEDTYPEIIKSNNEKELLRELLRKENENNDKDS